MKGYTRPMYCFNTLASRRRNQSMLPSSSMLGAGEKGVSQNYDQVYYMDHHDLTKNNAFYIMHGPKHEIPFPTSVAKTG